VDIAQVSERFPSLYEYAALRRKFHTNRFSLVYDNTDHPYLPKIGTYASASAQYSNERLGSDFEYRTYALQMKNYYNYKEEGRFVTAVHSLLQFQRGDDLPFYALPQLGESTGLRMAGDGRFVDRGKLIFSIEERITLTRSPFFKFISETEIAPFLDIGTVFPKPSAFRARKLKYGPGISARLVIRPQLVAAMDLAFGSEGTNAIIRVGYPF
jgi:outer membrane protein assembly factor BamA